MRMRFPLCFILILGLAFAASAAQPQLSSKASSSSEATTNHITVPLSFEQHRPYTVLTLLGPSGQPVHARFWLDTGGGAIVLSGPLAKRLGLKPSGKTFKAEGNLIAATEAPRIQVGHMALRLRDANAFLVISKEPKLEGTGAQGAFPLRALRNYQIVLDYPHGKLTIAEPGSLKPQGKQIAAHFSKFDFIALNAQVSGHKYGFLLDTGGQYCMISKEAMEQWIQQNPRWPHVAGAYGPANMMLGRIETSLEMLRIGAMRLGPFVLNDVGSISRPKGNYEKSMSRLTGRPVIGSIGGNALQYFRVDIDYPHKKLYLKRLTTGRGEPLDMVGITLERSKKGYVVAGVAKGETGISKGDRLLRIDGTPIGGMTNAEILGRLTGKLGAKRTLTVERDGSLHRVEVRVIKII